MTDNVTPIRPSSEEPAHVDRAAREHYLEFLGIRDLVDALTATAIEASAGDEAEAQHVLAELIDQADERDKINAYLSAWELYEVAARFVDSHRR